VQAGWSGELYYAAPPTQRTDWRTSECPLGEQKKKNDNFT
jgi:hypothetical protein